MRSMRFFFIVHSIQFLVLLCMYMYMLYLPYISSQRDDVDIIKDCDEDRGVCLLGEMGLTDSRL